MVRSTAWALPKVWGMSHSCHPFCSALTRSPVASQPLLPPTPPRCSCCRPQGAILRLLAESYTNRDLVSLIPFCGNKAQVGKGMGKAALPLTAPMALIERPAVGGCGNPHQGWGAPLAWPCLACPSVA